VLVSGGPVTVVSRYLDIRTVAYLVGFRYIDIQYL